MNEFECPRCGHCCQQRELVRLTDEEIFKIYMNSGGANIKDCFDFERLICVIEDKLKEKNTCQSK